MGDDMQGNALRAFPCISSPPGAASAPHPTSP